MVLSGIEEQVSRANQHKEQQLGLKQHIESEVSRRASRAVTAAGRPRGQGLAGSGTFLVLPTPFILVGCQPEKNH